MTDFYIIDVNSKSLTLCVLVNDVPLYLDPSAQGLRTVRTINEWLIKGQNTIAIDADFPDGLEYSPGLATLSVRVYEADPRSSTPRPGRVLAEYTFPEPEQDEIYPISFEQSFLVETVATTRLWEQAQTIEILTGEDRAAILGLVESLRNALISRDFNLAYELSTVKFMDDAVANGNDPVEFRSSILQQFEMMMDVPELESRLLADQETELHLVGSNRIVRVVGPNDTEAIVFENDIDECSIDIYCAKINNQWQIVR